MSKYRIKPKDDLGTKLEKTWAACIRVHNLKEDITVNRLIAITGVGKITVGRLLDRLVKQGKLRVADDLFHINTDKPKFDPANGKITRAPRYTGVI